jgi:hypothetical protein
MVVIVTQPWVVCVVVPVHMTKLCFCKNNKSRIIIKLQTHTRKSLEFLGEVADTGLALVGLQSLNGLSNVIDCRRVREASARLVAKDKRDSEGPISALSKPERASLPL